LFSSLLSKKMAGIKTISWHRLFVDNTFPRNRIKLSSIIVTLIVLHPFYLIFWVWKKVEWEMKKMCWELSKTLFPLYFINCKTPTFSCTSVYFISWFSRKRLLTYLLRYFSCFDLNLLIESKIVGLEICTCLTV